MLEEAANKLVPWKNCDNLTVGALEIFNQPQNMKDTKSLQFWNDDPKLQEREH